MATKVRCPNPDCGQSYSIASENLSGKARCKKCGFVFEMSSSVDRSSAPKASGSKDSSMPDRLGRFLIRAKLGSGAFGTVYRAFDPSLDREVALKVPQAGLLDSPRAVERFLREARAAARLRHPHIVPLYETGLDDGRHYIASAYIEGTTLADIIEPGGIGSTRAAKIALQLAEALHYAHSEKIVHRDVKPANVMLDAKGDAHLMDFGLARFELSEEKLTQDGAILGTPAYMAPEQAIGRSGEANAASDQYSLGVTLYELLCGQTPFSGPPEVVLFQVTEKEPQRPRAVNPAIPRDLETICLKAMAKAPKDRYAGCGDFAEDLRRWLMDEPIRARRQGLLEQSRRWARRNPTIAALTLTVGILLTAVALVATILEQRAQHQRHLAEQATNRLVEEQTQTNAALREAQTQRVRAEDKEREAKTERARAEEATKEIGEANKSLSETNEKLDKANQAQAKQYKESQRLLCKSALDRGSVLCEQGDVDRGLLWLARSLEIASRENLPDYNRIIRCDLAAWSRELVRSKKIFDTKSDCTAVAFSEDGTTILLGSSDRTARLFDTITGSPVGKEFSHPGPVNAVAFSPDGNTILTGCGDTFARLWDIKTAKESRALQHPKSVNSVAFSKDGARILTASDDDKARLWETVSGKQIGQPIEHPRISTPRDRNGVSVPLPRAIKAVAISPDGNTILTGSSDKTARRWDVKTREEIGRSLQHSGTVRSVAFSPDGNTILTGSENMIAQLWDIQTNDEIGRGFPHPASVVSVAFSQDGNTILVGGGRVAQLWDARTRELVGRPIKHPGEIRSVAISSDGVSVLTGGTDKTARLWDARRGDLSRRLVGYHGTGYSVAFSPDGNKILTTGSHDRTQSASAYAQVWDAKTGEPLGEPIGPAMRDHRQEINQGVYKHKDVLALFKSVAFSPDGRFIGLGTDGGAAWLLNLETGKRIGPLEWQSPTTKPLNSMEFSPDSLNILICREDVIGLWDTKTGKNVSSMWGHTIKPIISVAFSPDSKSILFGCGDNSARLCDVTTHDLLLIHNEIRHEGPVNSVAFSPDGKTILTGSDDMTARRWDASTGELVGRPFHHPGKVRVVKFSRDGNTILIGGADGTARLWDVKTREPIGLPIRNSEPILSAAFSPDGGKIVIGCNTYVEIFKFPTEISGSVQRIVLDVELSTGCEIDADGEILKISNQGDLADRRKRLKELNEPATP